MPMPRSPSAAIWIIIAGVMTDRDTTTADDQPKRGNQLVTGADPGH
jgi:hypothetical protein